MSVKDWSAISCQEAAKDLKVDMTMGLTDKEVAARLKTYGKNVIEKGKKDKIIFVFLRQFCDFMVMVLLFAAIISAACGETVDALMILAIIILNGVLGFVQEYKAEKSLAALEKLYTPESVVLREGKERIVLSENIVPGDIVILRQGDKAPADIRLTEAYNIETEEAVLTGESAYVEKTSAVIDAVKEISAKKNMVFSGTTIVKGRGMGIVTATGMSTEMGRIAGLLDSAGNEPTPLQLRLKSLGKWLITICVGVCAIVSVLGILTGGDVYTMILTGVSLGVASIPEGLPAIVTICLALGVWRLAKYKAIVKKLPAVETLGSTTVICSDKTGTLTENTMVLDKVYIKGRWHLITELTEGDLGVVGKVMAYCHSLRESAGSMLGDPTEAALYNGLKKLAPNLCATKKIDYENPFDSGRRLMSVLVDQSSLVKGAPDTVISKCDKVLTEKGIQTIDDIVRKSLLREVDTISRRGYRILALAYRENIVSLKDMENSLTFGALVALADPIREDAVESLKISAKAGVKTVMITGDHSGTAFAVAKSLGIADNENQIMLGRELEEEVRPIDDIRVFARVSPEDKMRIVRHYKNRGEVVAMTGDGVNDAPALREADIGIAMGMGGSDVTKEAADFILSDNNFTNIVHAIEEGRGIYDNIRKFVRYLLSSNLGEVLTMFIAVLFGFPLPLVPLQILWINLVTDGLPALALGLEKPGKETMERPPRPKSESVFARGLGAKIVVRGCIIGFTAIGIFLGAIMVYGDMTLARTMAFTALVFSQLFYVFDCRSENDTPFSLGFFSNIYLVWAVLISVALQCLVLYNPWLSRVFLTSPLSLEQWGVILLLTSLPTFIGAFWSFSKKKLKNIFEKQEK